MLKHKKVLKQVSLSICNSPKVRRRLCCHPPTAKSGPEPKMYTKEALGHNPCVAKELGETDLNAFSLLHGRLLSPVLDLPASPLGLWLICLPSVTVNGRTRKLNTLQMRSCTAAEPTIHLTILSKSFFSMMTEFVVRRVKMKSWKRPPTHRPKRSKRTSGSQNWHLTTLMPAVCGRFRPHFFVSEGHYIPVWPVCLVCMFNSVFSPWITKI